MFRVYPLLLETRTSGTSRVEFDIFTSEFFRASTRPCKNLRVFSSRVFSSKVPTLLGIQKLGGQLPIQFPCPCIIFYIHKFCNNPTCFCQVYVSGCTSKLTYMMNAFIPCISITFNFNNGIT